MTDLSTANNNKKKGKFSQVFLLLSATPKLNKHTKSTFSGCLLLSTVFTFITCFCLGLAKEYELTFFFFFFYLHSHCSSHLNTFSHYSS